MGKVRVSEKINNLFAQYLKPNGKPHTYQEVSESTGLTTSHLWRLRNREIKNPTPETLEKIRAFFGAPENYFDDVFKDEIGEFEDTVIMRSRKLNKRERNLLMLFLDGLIEDIVDE